MSRDATVNASENPGHVAIIMDGNGRWATGRGRPRAFGHSRGVEAVRKVVEAAGDLGVRYLTLFSFSTENWNRPADEVGALFELLKRYVEADLESLHRRGARVRIIGRRDNLSEDLMSIIEKAESRTRNNDSFHLTIAFNYGGRDELVRAAARLAEAMQEESAQRCRELSETDFSRFLDTADLPDVDLVIRTSGEMRVSNFLLWQAAYAEYIFLDVLWPDFTPDHLAAALDTFRNRTRRYGGVDVGVA